MSQSADAPASPKHTSEETLGIILSAVQAIADRKLEAA
jgi:hypothetical protein